MQVGSQAPVPAPAEQPQRPLAVVAMGGHAFIQKGQPGNIENHHENAAVLSSVLISLIERDYNLVITHGNGPQVGQLLSMSDRCRDTIPEMPLDVLVADTGGWLGYVMQQALLNEIRRRGIRRYVVTMISQVLVDRRDPAFKKPSKPVGRFFEQSEAENLRDTLGWDIAEDSGRGWRRVVPSPKPLRVIQRDMIRETALQGHLVVACGGGGIPIIKDGQGNYCGVEAVVDKDLTSSVLASSIGADLLIILTDVPQVYIDFNKPTQRALSAVTIDDIERLIDEGHFGAGSMGPKVDAVRNFLRQGGRRALITSPEHLDSAVNGSGGTHFVGSL